MHQVYTHFCSKVVLVKGSNIKYHRTLALYTCVDARHKPCMKSKFNILLMIEYILYQFNIHSYKVFSTTLGLVVLRCRLVSYLWLFLFHSNHLNLILSYIMTSLNLFKYFVVHVIHNEIEKENIQTKLQTLGIHIIYDKWAQWSRRCCCYYSV